MEITSDQIKLLRAKTGAGIANCKKALIEAKGDFEKAELFLTKLGLASAEKKTERTTNQGIITSYIHTGGKLGLLLELNCESDFVARRMEFQNLAKILAMELAGTPWKEYFSLKEIPEDIYQREYTLIAQSSEIQELSAEQRENKIKEILEEKFTTLGQISLHDPSTSLMNLIRKHIALVGENIQVGRVSKFILGEK